MYTLIRNILRTLNPGDIHNIYSLTCTKDLASQNPSQNH